MGNLLQYSVKENVAEWAGYEIAKNLGGGVSQVLAEPVCSGVGSVLGAS